MIELVTSREFGIGLLSAAIPLALVFLAWVLRYQLGLFRRQVRWSVVSQFSDSAVVKSDDRERPIKWTYLLLSVSPGAEAIRDLKVYINAKVTGFQISPDIPNAKLEYPSDEKSIISIERIEAGSYQVLLTAEGYISFYRPVSAVSADNARCVEKSVPKSNIMTFWSLLPNRLAWLLVWSFIVQGILNAVYGLPG